MFLGGVKFDDLAKLPRKLDLIAENRIKLARINHIFKICEQFGVIEKKKDFILEKNHCFIVYQQKESLDKAIETLSKYDERLRITKELKTTLEQQNGKAAIVNAPTAHFWRRLYTSSTEYKINQQVYQQ